ncbi:MAG: 7TM diverse intracellular signaling domain-containing protein [Ketobacteraceae bacterium]|nr:7TM diverse intracellular signaling domain-containing protein [Ketobacteraceae bacterium]
MSAWSPSWTVFAGRWRTAFNRYFSCFRSSRSAVLRRLRKRRSDNAMPFEKRELNHVFSVFPVTLSLGETRRLYVKMENPAPSTCRLPLWEPEAYAVKVANEEFLYGSMLCIIVFNLLIYFSVRDVGYLYYIGYLAGITLLFFIDLGHGA